MVWVRVKRRVALAMGGALIAIAIAGCAQIQTTAGDIYSASHMQPLGIDPSSPIAADAARAEQTTGSVPSYSSMPPKPTDIRAPSAYKAEVVSIVGDRRQLAQWEAAHPQETKDSEGYAGGQRDKFTGMAAPPATQDENVEAFAKKQRDAAEAPPRKSALKPGEQPAEDKKSKTAPSAY